jgi:hypothetical protein
MKVLMALEHHFARTPDGRVYGEGPAGYTLWSRRLEVFEEVAVLARVRRIDAPRENMTRSDGPGVSFFDCARGLRYEHPAASRPGQPPCLGRAAPFAPPLRSGSGGRSV